MTKLWSIFMKDAVDTSSSPTNRQSRVHPTALLSLIFGIISFFVIPLILVTPITALVAVILGHIARYIARKRPEYKAGNTIALIGLILGYVLGGFMIAFLVLWGTSGVG